MTMQAIADECVSHGLFDPRSRDEVEAEFKARGLWLPEGLADATFGLLRLAGYDRLDLHVLTLPEGYVPSPMAQSIIEIHDDVRVGCVLSGGLPVETVLQVKSIAEGVPPEAAIHELHQTVRLATACCVGLRGVLVDREYLDAA